MASGDAVDDAVCGRDVMGKDDGIIVKPGKFEVYKKAMAALTKFFDKYGALDVIGRMATINSVLAMAFPDTYWFCGFYLVHPEKTELLGIGPYQGKVLACGEIPFSKGVCGACARDEKTVVVDDVREFEGYIACDDSTLSEIVVPVFDSTGSLWAVLDIDSEKVAAFDAQDAEWLETIIKGHLTPFIPSPKEE